MRGEFQPAHVGQEYEAAVVEGTPLPDGLPGWTVRGYQTLPPLDAIYARLTEILRELFEDDTIVARPDLTADKVDGWDSFAQLQILFEVEKSFGITFAASQVSSLKNVGELAELIHEKA